jgi:hypothetical protein
MKGCDMTKIEKALTAVSLAYDFETNDRGGNLLIAMRELLASLKSNEFDSRGYLVDPEDLQGSFLALFQLWLGVTGLTVTTPKDPTIEDAFTALHAVSGVPA